MQNQMLYKCTTVCLFISPVQGFDNN